MLAYLASLQVAGGYLEAVLLPLWVIEIALLADSASAIAPLDTPFLLNAKLAADRRIMNSSETDR